MEEDDAFDFTITTKIEYRILEYCKNGQVLVNLTENNIRDIKSKITKFRNALCNNLCFPTTSDDDDEQAMPNNLSNENEFPGNIESLQYSPPPPSLSAASSKSKALKTIIDGDEQIMPSNLSNENEFPGNIESLQYSPPLPSLSAASSKSKALKTIIDGDEQIMPSNLSNENEFPGNIESLQYSPPPPSLSAASSKSKALKTIIDGDEQIMPSNLSNENEFPGNIESSQYSQLPPSFLTTSSKSKALKTSKDRKPVENRVKKYTDTLTAQNNQVFSCKMITYSSNNRSSTSTSMEIFNNQIPSTSNNPNNVNIEQAPAALASRKLNNSIQSQLNTSMENHFEKNPKLFPFLLNCQRKRKTWLQPKITDIFTERKVHKRSRVNISSLEVSARDNTPKFSIVNSNERNINGGVHTNFNEMSLETKRSSNLELLSKSAEGEYFVNKSASDKQMECLNTNFKGYHAKYKNPGEHQIMNVQPKEISIKKLDNKKIRVRSTSFLMGSNQIRFEDKNLRKKKNKFHNQSKDVNELQKTKIVTTYSLKSNEIFQDYVIPYKRLKIDKEKFVRNYEETVQTIEYPEIGLDSSSTLTLSETESSQLNETEKGELNKKIMKQTNNRINRKTETKNRHKKSSHSLTENGIEENLHSYENRNPNQIDSEETSKFTRTKMVENLETTHPFVSNTTKKKVRTFEIQNTNKKKKSSNVKSHNTSKEESKKFPSLEAELLNAELESEVGREKKRRIIRMLQLIETVENAEYENEKNESLNARSHNFSSEESEGFPSLEAELLNAELESEEGRDKKRRIKRMLKLIEIVESTNSV
ncbi:putative uncharacterized protein DDB_G0277255 [Chrysoperla carnea]|uniref:putative uncharacterized protein DDB_G0277255 n=1 Tax=Chrysoperla carnea TaxID=189513 RepID=UPI001D065F5F|nr:putative uncharacterized protein DDB_G0277255 [Chrysoperla carnea]